VVTLTPALDFSPRAARLLSATCMDLLTHQAVSTPHAVELSQRRLHVEVVAQSSLRW